MVSLAITICALYLGVYAYGVLKAFSGSDEGDISGFTIMFVLSFILLISPVMVFFNSAATLKMLSIALLPGLLFFGVTLFLINYKNKTSSTAMVK